MMDEHHGHKEEHHDLGMRHDPIEDHPEYPKEGTDISRKTLVILVILSVSISLIGALAMVYELSSVHVAPVIVENGGQDAATVSFAIGAAPEEEGSASATGMVAFEVRR